MGRNYSGGAILQARNEAKKRKALVWGKKRAGVTFVLAQPCSDGLVVVADRRLTQDDGSVHYGNKLLPAVMPATILMGFAGSEGHYQQFHSILSQVCYRYIKEMGDLTIDEFQAVLKTTVEIMREEHGQDYGHDSQILTVVRTNMRPCLFYLEPRGTTFQQIQGDLVLGPGEDVVSLFLNRIGGRHRLTMAEATKLGYFCIALFERFRLNAAIGLDDRPPYDQPQVFLVPNEGSIRQLTREELTPIGVWCKGRLDQLGDFLDGFL